MQSYRYPRTLLYFHLAGALHCADGSPASGGAFGEATAVTAAVTGGFETQGTATGGAQCDDCIYDGDQQPCDANVSLESIDGLDGARAMGLCKQAQAGGWGVVSAHVTTAHEKPLTPGLALGIGLLPDFGPISPREGARMLVLSSGAARAPNHPNYHAPGLMGGFTKDVVEHAWPEGFTLQESSACSDVQTGSPLDSVMLEVKVKTPSNAKSLTFDLNLFTYEYPNYICSPFNDYFVALMSPPPTGAIEGNIAFDPMQRFISVNAGFLRACAPRVASNGQLFTCPLGYGDIVGTGFDELFYPGTQDPFYADPSASTSWLKTTAPVEAPGEEITLRFAIWDSSDSNLDSTILIDNFRFSFDPAPTGTVPIPK